MYKRQAAECIKRGGFEELQREKEVLIEEFNALGIEYLEIKDLNLLNGFFVNLEYLLENGQSVKFLEDRNVYWGNQIEIPGNDRCYGIVADAEYMLVCEYGCNGADPEIILYKKRSQDVYKRQVKERTKKKGREEKHGNRK